MYYRQPRYFGEFQCMGSDCPDNCCYGWRIDWKKDEIEKVKNAENISPELKELVENSFVPINEERSQYMIKFPKSQKCPFQTNEGLCKIQRELGAEYLSYTCTIYPRCNILAENAIYNCCYMSCPVVQKKLMNDERSMDMINIPMKSDIVSSFTVANSAEKCQAYPELNHRGLLLDFFYDLISDKKISLETAIILGALVAQKLTDIIAHKEYDRIPEALKAFRKQFHNAAQLKAIENIKPNYYLKFGFLAQIIEKIVENGATVLLRDETGTLNIDMYNKGECRLAETLKGREFFLRNLALNLLFEFAVPFKLEEKTIFENYSLFVAAFGCLKLNLIAVCSTEKGINFRTYEQVFNYTGDDKLIGMSAIISRGICQASGKAKMIINCLNDNKFTTPAYLALLVK